jgi:hypothetical protein
MAMTDKMTMFDVFVKSVQDGMFPYHMSNFAHMFLDDPSPKLIEREPPRSPEIEKSTYVYAACFCHYWSNVFMFPVPEWVHDNFYKHDTPTYSQPLLKDWLNEITPHQFKAHNMYMPSKDVVYV